MNEQTFVERRDAEWRRLSELCDRGESNPGRLQGDDLRDLVRLYRRVSSDLAIARTRTGNVPLVDFLNGLAGRAYGVLYHRPRRNLLTAILEAIALSAQTVRRRRAFVFLSALIFFGSALGAAGLMQVRPDTREYFVPAGFESAFESWKRGEHEARTGSESLAMTGFYASNNPRASIIAGSVGAGSFGTLSVYMLATNGAMLGVLAHEVTPAGHLGFLLSSIAPHGVPELTGIIVAAACGMLLGWALIHPGRLSRADSLRAVGRDALVLLGTSVVLMFIAAPIEGFFSFHPSVPQPVKAAVALVTLGAWLTFWSQYGKTPAEAAARLRKSEATS